MNDILLDSDLIIWSDSPRRESSLFNGFWSPRSSRRMTNFEFMDRH
ncbi:MAG: hypothetical protein WC769_02705 [Thermodesulfovibrionales bacterium]